MKKVLAAAVVAATLPQAASALPLVDFYAGGYYWDQTVTGDAGSTTSTADLEDDLNLDAGGQNVVYFAFEHPIPVVPNVKVKMTDMSSDGNGTLTSNFSFGGQSYSASENVATELDLTHTDYTLYWGLPLPIVTLDFGLTLRQFDGSMAVASNTVNSSADLDVTVPMGYLKAGVDIPLTGLSLGGDINVISYGDSGITDYDLNMTYVLPVIPLLDVGITAGYRSFDLEINPDDFGGSDDDLSAKATVAGPYIGLSLHL
ncbi:MAG: TIGR04219 family outer membrane beta-barrel protein [Gammaproteobacteria bacterium]|nr:TIGR04219 family outer membrane beta-barrel protein [Gammaproteobacteria bacterium]